MIRRAAFFLVWLASLSLCSACARQSDVSSWLTEAETAQRDADRLLPAGDVNGARDVLRAAAEAPVPPGTKDADARIVRQDLYDRWALLEIDHGTPAEAIRVATRGLELGRENDVFTANLEIVRGHAYERLGDAASASRDYHDALLVTEALLDRSLHP